MLPQKHKLQLRHHQAFFSHAQKTHTKHFVLFVEPTQGFSKGAVIVPAKKVASAVARNKHKRMIKAALARVIKAEVELKPQNIVVYCKRRLSEKEASNIDQELAKALTQI